MALSYKNTILAVQVAATYCAGWGGGCQMDVRKGETKSCLLSDAACNTSLKSPLPSTDEVLEELTFRALVVALHAKLDRGMLGGALSCRC